MLVARAAGGAELVFGVPHLLYHALHLDPFATGDAVALLVSLTIAALAASPGRAALSAGEGALPEPRRRSPPAAVGLGPGDEISSWATARYTAQAPLPLTRYTTHPSPGLGTPPAAAGGGPPP